MTIIDTHTHFDLTLEGGTSTEESLIAGLIEANITRAVQVSIDVPSARWSIEFAERNSGAGILFTLGIHPSSRAGTTELAELRELVTVTARTHRELFFAVGECGLDYYRMHQPKDMQHNSFEFQIDLAAACGLPLVVHSRDAMDETIAVLKAKAPQPGIMHCFSGTPDSARRVMDLGFYLSFAGNVTYPKALDLQNSVRYTPLDRILVETDAPFLTPVPHRGKKNNSSFILHTYRFLADLKKVPLEKFAAAVNDNFERVRRFHA